MPFTAARPTEKLLRRFKHIYIYIILLYSGGGPGIPCGTMSNVSGVYRGEGLCDLAMYPLALNQVLLSLMKWVELLALHSSPKKVLLIDDRPRSRSCLYTCSPVG